MLTDARALKAAGYSIIPVNTDGTKSPAIRWKPYQTRHATDDEITRWFTTGDYGLAVVCGTVSRQLEMLEFEGRAVADGLDRQFAVLMHAAGHADLLTRIMTGHSERSPSGGIHLFYRVEGPVDGNLKLASREATDDELTPAERTRYDATGRRPPRVLIETRGEGGYVIVAPTNGTTHPTGLPWTVLSGGADTVPVITVAQRADLLGICRALDQLPHTLLSEPAGEPAGGLTPGDDYTARASWSDILEPAGWVAVSDQGGRVLWRRPGKDLGVSAATGGPAGDYLYVWSTSTDLPDNVGISKWRAYAMIHHGGDYSAAARALRAQGYGDTRQVLPVAHTPDNGGQAATVAVNAVSHSDDGNAATLLDRYAPVIRYAIERQTWLGWTGRRWEWTGTDGGHIREYAKAIGRCLPENDTKAVNHKRYSLSDRGITAMVRVAKTDPRVVITTSSLDARPYELATPDGIIDLRTGRVTPHDPTHLHTRLTLVAPNNQADATVWQSFLDQTFAGHPELPGYLQRLVGYSACGQVREHVLPFCYGEGGNGKSVFLGAIMAVLGDYGTPAPNRFLMAQTFDSHPTEIARLTGTRMVVCSEINSSDRFDEAKVKALTGGDRITARFMRENEFTFTPSHTLWLMGNHQPTVEAGGRGFWRRLRLIPFVNTVARDREVPDLQGVLVRDHAEAIMSWIVAGAISYLRSGLQEPDSVRAATDEYAHDQDSLARFVDEMCFVSTNAAVKTNTKVVRSAYTSYCAEAGLTALNATAFGRQLRARYGVDSVRANGERYYGNLSLMAPEPVTANRSLPARDGLFD